MEFDKNGILNRAKAAQQSAAVIDEGLRAYMLKVYNYMATGVLLTGIVALLTFQMGVEQITSAGIILTPFGNTIYNSGLAWVVMLAPLAIVFYMSFGINKMSASKAQTTFWVFAALMGLSLSSILLVYTGMSVTRVFFITSATFGAMSIYGYTTKRDLTGIVALLTFKMSVVTNDAGSIVGLTQMGNAIYLSGLKWLVMLAPLGIVFYMSFGINKMLSLIHI